MQSNDAFNPAAKVLPDAASNLNKKEQVADMFNNIAGKYDFLNHFLSLGIDKGWRKKAVQEVAAIHPQKILDVATGTGDLAIAAAKTGASTIIGVDIAEQMLEVGRQKIKAQKLEHLISLQLGDSEALPFESNSFDAGR